MGQIDKMVHTENWRDQAEIIILPVSFHLYLYSLKMGGSQSSSSKVVSVQGTPSETSLPAGQFSVSYSGPMLEKGLQYKGNLEKELQNAYEQGKNEGLATVQQTLSVVAVKTFEQIHSQIVDLQTKNIEESKVLVRVFILYRYKYFIIVILTSFLSCYL